ncbi:MAG: EamA family transporter, partial [Mycobacterium sp.]
MIGAAYAQLSAVSYGVGDFVGGVAARRVAALRVMLVSYPIAAVLLGVLAISAGGPVRSGAVLWGSLYGISQAIGVWWFYAALGAGPISVVSPLAAVLNAAVPVAAGVAFGERPGQTACVGVVLAMLAVFLVGRESPDDEDVRTHRFTRKVAWLTIGAGVAFGLDFVLLHQAPVECRLWPLFFARVSATVLVFAVARATGNFQLPSKIPLRLAVAAALLDSCANIAMLMALHAWLLSLASMLISLYPAATVV